jgi:LacI family transcriptional regulator
MKVTIKDIAAAAGVSIGTVDRVLHNREHVSSKKRSRVLKEIERLNYVPNRYASLLSTGAHKSIGLICPSDPPFFWNEIVNGAEAAASDPRSSGIELHIRKINTNDFVSGDKYINIYDELIEKSIDILLTIGIARKKITEVIKNCPVPVAIINMDIPDYPEKVFYIGPEEERCGSIAAGLIGKLLKGRGTVVTACPVYGDTVSYSSEMRIRGFKKSRSEFTDNSYPYLRFYGKVRIKLICVYFGMQYMIRGDFI